MFALPPLVWAPGRFLVRCLLCQVEQAQKLSSAQGDSFGESGELAILGLALWSIDNFKAAEMAIKTSAMMLQNSRDSKEAKSALVSLALAQYSLGLDREAAASQAATQPRSHDEDSSLP